MATLITAIQCPRCGSTQKTELRPGDFRCDSCGTEYFLDNGTVIGRPDPTKSSPITPKRVNPASIAMGVGIVIILIASTLILTISSSGPAEKNSTASYVPTPAGPAEDPSYWSNSESHLYLSADHLPILLTFGTKIHHDHPEKNASYVSFTDVSDGAEIKRVPVPAATPPGESPAEFSLRQFANGDIYIIANNTLLYRIQPTAYAIKDVTKTLFENQKELVSGIAKIDYVYPNLGEGFNLMTNDGKTFFYYPVTVKLYTEKTVYTERLDAKIPTADSTEKTGFSFSVPYNDATDASQQLIKFQYRDAKNARPREFEHYSGYKWDDPQILKEQGIISYKDFTPGRTYSGYRLLYWDDDYVLFSYLISPARGASRNLQCLNAHTAAIVFTTRLDADESPTASVRYKDGFALAAIPDMYTLDLHGKLTKRVPIMYKND